jgi:hypothetical protein
MSIIFNDLDHSYKSTSPEEQIDWVSVTTLVSNFKKPFDAKAVAEKVSKSKRSKWNGVDPKIIQEIWNNEGKRATDLGTFYHNQRESDICSLASIEKEGIPVPVISPIVKDGLKIAPEQKLGSGIYPEHLVYLKSAGICGQSDLVEVYNNTINIIDYKTNKEIKTESYKNWEGISEKLEFPLNHLDDCNFNHYALQLSIYMYMMLKHNPKLKPGKMFIHHVIFEIEGEDQWGYPIAVKDENGDPIVKEVIPILVPYLKDEVINIINWLRENKDKIKKK